MPPLGNELLRSQGRIAVHGSQMLGKRVARKVEEIAFQAPDGAIYLDRFVDEVAHPPGAPPVVETHLAVRIPARMEDPAAEILGHSRNCVGIVLCALFLDLPDFALECFT